MTGLPSKISNAAPVQPSLKQTASDNANQQEESDFSNVLARQVDDTDKQQPASHTKKGQGKLPAEPKSTETTLGMDIAPAGISADILAALLIQQNPETSPQPDDLSRLATDSLRGGTQTPQLIPDSRKPQPSLADATGVTSDDTKGIALFSAAVAATAKPDLANKGKIEITDRRKLSGALEAGIQTSIRVQNSNPTDALTLSAPAHLLTAPLPASAPTNPNAINTPVSQPAWGDELGQKITWMATQRNQSAELHLNPPQLGPLDVTLKINGDQATALFVSPHAAVRDAIEQALPRLRELLADSGIMLGNAMVSDQSAKNFQDNTPRKSQNGSHTDSAGNAEEVKNALKAGSTATRQHNGMVDTFA